MELAFIHLYSVLCSTAAEVSMSSHPFFFKKKTQPLLRCRSLQTGCHRFFFCSPAFQISLVNVRYRIYTPPPPPPLALICHLFLPFSLSFDVVTYLSNSGTDSEFVKVVTHLRVLIRKEFFTVRISPPPRMTDLCVCVCFRNHIIRPHLISRWGRWNKGAITESP